MKYVKPYMESSIPFQSDLVDLYNKYKELAEPVTTYFREYCGMNKVNQETSLDSFITLYLARNKGNGVVLNLKENLKKSNLHYFIEVLNPDFAQVKYKFHLHIDSEKIHVIIDGRRPAHLIVQDLIKFECKNGKKLLNILNELKNYNKNLSFCIYSSKVNKGNLIGKQIDLVSITDCLKIDDAFDSGTLIRISPMIFKFGTDDEIKRFWDKMNKNYNTVKQMMARDRVPPKTGYPDCRGYLSRLRKIINLSDDEISHADDLGQMGFSD